jgi:hypothetical protein
MATSPDAPSAPAKDHGLSRRSVLTRSAAGLGIALSGSLNGLFGTESALGDNHRDGGGDGNGADKPAGYGPLATRPGCSRCRPASRTRSSRARA